MQLWTAREPQMEGETQREMDGWLAGLFSPRCQGEIGHLGWMEGSPVGMWGVCMSGGGGGSTCFVIQRKSTSSHANFALPQLH